MSTESGPGASGDDGSLASAMLPVFDRLAPDPPSAPPARALRLVAEGAFYTALALGVATAMDFPQSGFIAIFLSAAGQSGRLSRVLDDNRRAIYVERRPARRANRATVEQLLALFSGALIAFSLFALWLGEAGLGRGFGFVLDATQLGRDTLLDRRFGGAPALLSHNALVLLFFVALSFIYRAYGAMLVLCWNACTWGLALTLLARRGVVHGEAGAALTMLLALLATLPHLLLEASAYVVGAIAAIFLSRAYPKYRFGDPRLASVLRSVGRLLVVSLGCLVAAALVESTLPSLAAGWLRR